MSKLNGQSEREKIKNQLTFNALFLSAGNISLDASSSPITKRSYLKKKCL